jgi:uncharacterized lipoprotein YmbA
MKLLRHPASCKLAAIVAASLVMGCLGSSPNIDLYTMSAASESVTSAAPDGLAIGVGPIRVPRYLDRPEWVTRPGGSISRLEVDGVRRWAGGFSTNVLSALGENLGIKLNTQRVVVYPSQIAIPLDYRIGVDFQAFEVIGKDALVLRANWMIRAGKVGGGPWSGHFATRRSLAGGSPDNLVAAHNEALDLLASTIASRIESLAEARASTEGSENQHAN